MHLIGELHSLGNVSSLPDRYTWGPMKCCMGVLMGTNHEICLDDMFSGNVSVCGRLCNLGNGSLMQLCPIWGGPYGHYIRTWVAYETEPNL